MSERDTADLLLTARLALLAAQERRGAAEMGSAEYHSAIRQVGKRGADVQRLQRIASQAPRHGYGPRRQARRASRRSEAVGDGTPLVTRIAAPSEPDRHAIQPSATVTV
jgi:hypothetical protein